MQLKNKCSGNIWETDEFTTISQMQETNPLFFKNKHKGETRFVHRGQMIVRIPDEYAEGGIRFGVWLYLRDPDEPGKAPSMLCASSGQTLTTRHQAKMLVNEILDSGEF